MNNQFFGSMSIPIGTKYSADGIGLRIHYGDKTLTSKLVHNQNCVIENGNRLITTCEKIVFDKDITF
jgi:hypothetical protein